MADNLTVATIFIVLLNVLMWFSSIAMLDMNATGSVCYNLKGSVIESNVVGVGNATVINNNVIDQLPGNQNAVTSGSTNIFTDIFNNIVNWFKTTPGIKYIYGVIAAPYNILKCLGLPVEFIVGIGALWYMVTFLILVAFLWGR